MEQDYIILIINDSLGCDVEELGQKLMQNYLYALLEQPKLPQAIYFINKGINLTTKGSAALATIQSLAAKGCEIKSCGTCLDYYNKTKELAVGTIANMYMTVEATTNSNHKVLILG